MLTKFIYTYTYYIYMSNTKVYILTKKYLKYYIHINIHDIQKLHAKFESAYKGTSQRGSRRETRNIYHSYSSHWHQHFMHFMDAVNKSYGKKQIWFLLLQFYSSQKFLPIFYKQTETCGGSHRQADIFGSRNSWDFIYVYI